MKETILYPIGDTIAHFKANRKKMVYERVYRGKLYSVPFEWLEDQNLKILKGEWDGIKKPLESELSSELLK